MTDFQPPAPDESKIVDLQAMVRADREAREKACNAELQEAIAPILAKHRCRLVIRQEIIDGMPQPVRMTVTAND